MKTREEFKTYTNKTYITLYDESELLIRIKDKLTEKVY